jgi:hypothetical protein
VIREEEARLLIVEQLTASRFFLSMTPDTTDYAKAVALGKLYLTRKDLIEQLVQDQGLSPTLRDMASAALDLSREVCRVLSDRYWDVPPGDPGGAGGTGGAGVPVSPLPRPPSRRGGAASEPPRLAEKQII